MDYLIFLIGLFLIASGVACLFFFRDDRRLSRWPMLAMALAALALNTWWPIPAFALGWQSSSPVLQAVLVAAFATCLMGFALSPWDFPQKPATLLKWAATLTLGGLTLILGVAHLHSAVLIVPLLALTFSAAWKITPFIRHLFPSVKSPPPFVFAVILTTSAASALLPNSVESCYDLHGLGSSPARILSLTTLAAATAASIALAAVLWLTIYQANRHLLSRSLLRRRRLGSTAILTAAIIACANGAWLAHWLSNQAYQQQTATLLSSLRLSANHLDTSLINGIQGHPDEISSPGYASLRSQLLEIHQALPETRFAYLLGLRNQRLVFLVDAEDPTHTDTFSPPGETVKDYPQQWLPELAGSSSFKGPDRDGWGVWFSACVPIFNSNRQVVALLGVDYPATQWLQPTAARRLGAMLVVLSVATLLMVLFSFHLLSITIAQQVESLSELLSDAMSAAELDTWECFLNPFQLNVGSQIAATLGWTSNRSHLSLLQACRHIHPDDRHALFRLIRSSDTHQPTTSAHEVRLKDAHGQWIWFMLRGRLEFPHQTSTPRTRLVGTILDLTSTKKSEQNLISSRAEAARLALVAQCTDSAVIITDPAGHIEWVNEGFCKISGFSKDEVIGQQPGSFLQHPHDNPLERAYIRACLEAGSRFETEITNYHKNGQSYIIHIECQPLVDAHSTLTGFMAIEHDVTQIRRTTNLLEAVASINTTLLSKRIEPSVWNEILAAMGSAANADRCYIFQIHPHPVLGSPAMSQSAEWNSGTATPQFLNPSLQNFSFLENGYGRWLTELLANRDITGSLADFPAVEQPMLIAQEILSLAIVPIFTGDQLTGFMGFDACREDRIWHNWEIAILRSAAANIGLRQVAQNEADALVLARDEACHAAKTAENANRAKSTFLATISHEIRTPLNGVIGMASLLDTTPLNPQQHDFTQTILHSSNFLLEIITDILDYSRIESGHIELNLVPFFLAELCRNALDVVRPAAAVKPLDLTCLVAPNLPTQVIGDHARIHQILVNLLSNAVKFTPNGFISLIVNGHQPADGGPWQLTFEVNDSGIGVAPDTLALLFQPFVQADSSSTRRFGGSGLGLAICKRLAQSMNGDIAVKSTSGHGSTFLVSLPLMPATPNSSTEPAPTPGEASNATPLTSLKILVAEDNPSNQKIVRLLLQRLGIDADIVADGLQALTAARSNPYDIILLDLQMPVMDGLEASRKIRALHSSHRPWIVALTANAFHEDRTAATAAGMDDYLSKPITLDRLRTMIHSHAQTLTAASPLSPSPTLAITLPTRPLLNVTIIQNLTFIGIDGYKEVISGATAATSSYLESMLTTIAHADSQQLKELLHKFRGMLLQIGCDAMPARLLELENLPLPTPDQAPAIQAELATLWQLTLAAIKEWEKSIPEFNP